MSAAPADRQDAKDLQIEAARFKLELDQRQDRQSDPVIEQIAQQPTSAELRGHT
ncbi:hypothetical protein PP352_21580 [Mycobacteroides abscessus]|nr:hypothetical protein [Mycobacteroides abscessus]